MKLEIMILVISVCLSMLTGTSSIKRKLHRPSDYQNSNYEKTDQCSVITNDVRKYVSISEENLNKSRKKEKRKIDDYVINISTEELTKQVISLIQKRYYDIKKCQETEIVELNKSFFLAINEFFIKFGLKVLHSLSYYTRWIMNCICKKFSEIHRNLTEKKDETLEKVSESLENPLINNMLETAKKLNECLSITNNRKRRLRLSKPEIVTEIGESVENTIFNSFLEMIGLLGFSSLVVLFTILAFFVKPYLAIAAGACALIVIRIYLKKPNFIQ